MLGSERKHKGCISQRVQLREVVLSRRETRVKNIILGYSCCVLLTLSLTIPGGAARGVKR